MTFPSSSSLPPIFGIALIGILSSFHASSGINATTVALAYLLIVVGVSSFGNLVSSIVCSVVAVLALNYFFLPPVGSLTVDDPPNWAALLTFLITSITVSQLSAKAQRQSAEATERKRDTERLYDLGRATLLNDEFDRVLERTGIDIARIFELDEVCLFDKASNVVYRLGQRSTIPDDELAQVSQDREVRIVEGASITAVQLGGRTIGMLAMKASRRIEATVVVAVANLAAIAVERARTIELSTTAEAVRRSEELRAAILDAIAHDWKTPLTAIKASVTALLSDPAPLEAARIELLSIIDEETDSLNRTITEAVHIARVEAGKVVLDKSICHPVSVLHEAIAGLRNSELAARITWTDGTDGTSVFLDADLTRQAIHQVLDNARKYSKPTGLIHIQIVQEEDWLRFEIADAGPGVRLEEQSRIFQKFARGRQGAKMEGTGMGLYIAKRIMEAHGGSIAVRGNERGGATFVLSLPAPSKTV